MARKPRPLPFYLQKRPDRNVKQPARIHYSGGRLVYEDARYTRLPKKKKNPAHRTVRTKINPHSIVKYLQWLGTNKNLQDRPPKVPLGQGEWAVRVVYPLEEHPFIQWVDVMMFSDVVEAFEFAKAIRYYSNRPAEAYQKLHKGDSHAEKELPECKEPSSCESTS